LLARVHVQGHHLRCSTTLFDETRCARRRRTLRSPYPKPGTAPRRTPLSVIGRRRAARPRWWWYRPGAGVGRCSIDPDPGRDPPPNPNGRPSLGASSPAGHGNPVAHTHTDSWHTASTIDDQPLPRAGSARRIPAPTRDEPPPRKTPRSGATKMRESVFVQHFTYYTCIRYRAARAGRRSRRRGGRWQRW
jgi:hypothetical protein